MIRVERRAELSPRVAALVPLGAAVAALVLTAIPLLAAGAPVLRAFGLIAAGAAGSLFAITETLTRATPLIFTGLAAAIAFRARLWNIGAESQLYMGGLAAVALGSGAITLPAVAMVPLLCLAGAAAGALMLLGPAIAKHRLGADEVVTTLLLNFVAILLVQMMLEGPLKDPMGMGWPQSEPIVPEGALPRLVERMRLHAGFLIAVVAAVVLHVMMRATVWGYEIRAVGENAAAARYAGLPVGAAILRTACISGGLAGLAGVSEVAGLKGYLTADLSPGFGYAGIVVAMLAGLSPLAVVPSAIFIAAIFVGADTMGRTLGVSSYIADLVVALALLSVLVAGWFARHRVSFRRPGPGEART